MRSGERIACESRRRSAVLRGHEWAWREWYDQECPKLRTYVHWRCGGRADVADEIVQETWLIAVRRMRTFDPTRASFGSWLSGIAANLVRNHLRRRATEPLGELAAAEDVGRERAERITFTLAELPERYEAVLRAKYLDGQSVDAIAADWGETCKAIESLLTRARQAFRDAYGTEE